MADDDVPVTRPGLPFEPAELEDGPTLEVYVPDDDGTRTLRRPGATSSDFDQTVPLPPKRISLPDPEDLAETITLKREPEDPATLPLKRPPPGIDDLVTTPLGPPSGKTGPFLLVSPPAPSVPIPLARPTPAATLPNLSPQSAAPLLGAPVLPPPAPNVLPPPPPGPRRDGKLLLVFASGVLGTLAVALVIAVIVVAVGPGRSSRKGPEAQGSAAPRAGSPAGAATARCRVERDPRRIATRVLPHVPPMLAPALNPDEVALGVAESETGALGVVVDLADLSVEKRFSERLPRPVLRTTPYESGGTLRFVVDHDDEQLRFARTIPGPPSLTVGINFFGFARTMPGGDPRTLWPGGKGNAISEPMFATLPGVGHAVAFSRGKLGGSLHVGWLSRDGQPKTDLSTLEQNAYEIGSPAIAVGPRGALVAVSVRDARGAPWRIALAQAAPGKLPDKTVAMTTGAGPDRTMPSVAPLESGWLVSWLETSAQGRRVRAQVLDENLGAVEPPFDVAIGEGIENVRGGLQRVGSRALSVYVVRRARYELWASVIAC